MPTFPTAAITGQTGDKKKRNASTPQAQKPRTRPPTGLRDRLGILQAHLPIYSGPYSVGMMDIEVPAANPRHFSRIKRQHHHLLKLETVLISIYYPSGFGAGEGKDPSGQKTWSRETWLSRPRIKTAEGYGRFAGLPSPLVVPFFGATTMFTKIPAYRNATLARHWPPANNERGAGFRVKNESGVPPPGKPDEPVYPLMIFSHGLGGNRTAYSSLCGEYASYGFVVCAIEHRDGSGPRTYVNFPQHGEVAPGLDPNEQSEQDMKRKTTRSSVEQKQQHTRMDYIFPEGNARDTAPAAEKGVDTELRTAQMELRLAEIEEAYRVLQLIHDGKGEEVAVANMRRKGYVGGSTRGLIGVKWDCWKGAFHLDRVTLLGHSFGAATTIQALRDPERFTWVSQGVIYDIWGAPISDLDPPMTLPDKAYDLAHETGQPVPRPLLAISSEAFMFWETNFEIASRIVNRTRNLNNTPAWLMTVRGSIHVSQSDFSILYRRTCALLLKMTVNPQRAVDINVGTTLEFLKCVDLTGRSEILHRTMDDEGFLNVPVTEEMPTDRQPAKMWTAARLKVPHEFRSRFVPGLERRFQRKKNGVKGGVGGPEDEVWVHVAPGGGDIEEWRARGGLPLHREEQHPDGEGSSMKSRDREKSVTASEGSHNSAKG